jgi:hypothetical protein
MRRELWLCCRILTSLPLILSPHMLIRPFRAPSSCSSLTPLPLLCNLSLFPLRVVQWQRLLLIIRIRVGRPPRPLGRHPVPPECGSLQEERKKRKSAKVPAADDAHCWIECDETILSFNPRVRLGFQNRLSRQPGLALTPPAPPRHNTFEESIISFLIH